MYYLYHIPGKKIGVTRDLNTRVTLIQGYKENEYEVLEQSDDINYISDREIELQKSYGYKVDRKPYKHLFNKMNINIYKILNMNIRSNLISSKYSKFFIFKCLNDKKIYT